MNLTIKIYQIREGKNKKTRNVVLVVLSFLGLKNRQLTILKHSSQKKKKNALISASSQHSAQLASSVPNLHEKLSLVSSKLDLILYNNILTLSLTLIFHSFCQGMGGLTELPGWSWLTLHIDFTEKILLCPSPT